MIATMSRKQEETLEAISLSVNGRPLDVTTEPNDEDVPHQKGGLTFEEGDIAVVYFQHMPGYTGKDFDVATDEFGKLGNRIIWVIRNDGKIRMTYCNIAGWRGQAWNVKPHKRTKSRIWKLTHGKRIPLDKREYPTLWIGSGKGSSFFLSRVTMAMSMPTEYRRQGYRPFVRKPSRNVSSLSGMACDLARFACGDPTSGFPLMHLHVKYK